MNKELVLRGIVVSCALDNKEKNEILTYLDKLITDSNFLHCLEACGVDNWDGYGDANEMMDEEDN